MRQAAAPKVTASVRSPDVDLHKWGKQTTKVRELRRWEKHAHTWPYVSLLMCVKGRWCILGVHDANKKRSLAQNIFGLRLHYASSCMWSIFSKWFIARASTCGLNVNDNIEEDRIESRSILSILLYNLYGALQYGALQPPACHLHLLNKRIASSHSAALACLDNCRFNRLRGASARAARDALSTIRTKRHGVQSVGQQQTTAKVLQPCPIKLSWSPKCKDSQGYNQHDFNLKSELLYIGIVWTFAFCMILRSSVKWQGCKD